ncbi:hypothetical protein GWK36_08985 [Caldichromatium japonicum]|uniref:Uncharacterized protein n=1 Tax=Caldichromatium japonicum TaxID=2699430 RepID=A0A6G7VE20_9GAMM|nr:hypothetical protein [Caldichromatium japonicum]QIK38098.1 hypothetical protein GWK36_08985 [Caldichromatium japonicum]
MEKNWMHQIEDEDHARLVLHFARRGDRQAEKALLSAYFNRQHQGVPPFKEIEHWMNHAFALRGMYGDKLRWDECFAPDRETVKKKLAELDGLRECSKWMDDKEISEAVKRQIDKGEKTYDIASDDNIGPAFKLAAEELKELGYRLTPSTVRDRYYKSKRRR